VTTTFGSGRSAHRSRTAVRLWGRRCHQCRTTISGRITVNVRSALGPRLSIRGWRGSRSSGRGKSQVVFDVLQAAALGLGNLPLEVGQRDDGETGEQEERACAAEDAQNGQEGDGDREVRGRASADGSWPCSPLPVSPPRAVRGARAELEPATQCRCGGPAGDLSGLPCRPGDRLRLAGSGHHAVVSPCEHLAVRRSAGPSAGMHVDLTRAGSPSDRGTAQSTRLAPHCRRVSLTTSSSVSTTTDTQP
jgi:hypothetical protein